MSHSHYYDYFVTLSLVAVEEDVSGRLHSSPYPPLSIPNIPFDYAIKQITSASHHPQMMNDNIIALFPLQEYVS